MALIKGDDNGADGLSRYCPDIASIVSRIENKEDELLNEYHVATRHESACTMTKLLKEKYSWENMEKNIQHYVDTCWTREKAGNALQNSKNRVISATSVNQLWECDLIGRIPTDDKNKFIFTAINHYSK